jgi:hypothetical protein
MFKEGLTFNSGESSSGNQLPVPRMAWTDINSFYHNDTAVLRYLAIFDSCCAGLATIDTGIELLAASAWDSRASSNEKYSYTRFLVDAIKSHAGNPVTAIQLDDDIRNSSTEVLRTAQPVHHPPRTDLQSSVSFHWVGPRSTSGTAPKPRPGRPAKRMKVTIAVTVESPGKAPSAKAWSDWLSSNIPPDLQDIKINAKWKSNSTTFLITMPSELWAFMPDRLAYQFVGWVDGEILPGLVEELPLRATTSRENVPFDEGGGSSSRSRRGFFRTGPTTRPSKSPPRRGRSPLR